MPIPNELRRLVDLEMTRLAAEREIHALAMTLAESDAMPDIRVYFDGWLIDLTEVSPYSSARLERLTVVD